MIPEPPSPAAALTAAEEPRSGTAPRWLVSLAIALAILLALRVARPLMLPLVFAAMLAMLFAAPLRWLRHRGVAEPVGAAIIVGTLAATACGTVAALAEPAARWWYSVPTALRALLDALTRLHWDMLDAGSVESLRQGITVESATLTRLLIGDALVFAAEAAATAVLLFFLLIAQGQLLDRMLAALPSRRERTQLLGTLHHAALDLRRFIWTMTVANVALGAATGLLLAVVGLPHPVLWGVTTTVLTFVPYVGPLAVTLLLWIAASLAFDGGNYMFLPPLGFLLLHGIEANLISPWWMGYSLKLSRLAVLVAVMIFGWAWGVAGGFVAVPLLLLLRAACRRHASMALLNAFLQADAAPVVAAARSRRSGAQVRRLPK